MPETLLVIAGPTASGKTSLAIRLGEYFQTEIISADSRQFYREIPVGTAAPTSEQLKKLRHHFIGTLSIHEYYNASMFEEDALDRLKHLFKERDVVVMAGGSGMYIDAVCSGIDVLPAIDPEIRNQLKEQYRSGGIESLRMKLKLLDPASYDRVDLRNPNRILKALEVSMQTGKPYSSFLTSTRKPRPFRILKIGLNLPRPELYARIDRRVDEMIQNGLVEEARKLSAFRELNALNTVGYKELFQYLDGIIDLERAIELIKRNTRRFAKRQLTWFKRDEQIRWFHPASFEEIIRHIQVQLMK
jgi:tRNA dimethylallyltransferase